MEIITPGRDTHSLMNYHLLKLPWNGLPEQNVSFCESSTNYDKIK